MDTRQAAINLLAMYEARLRFIDVYDALVDKLAVFLQETIEAAQLEEKLRHVETPVADNGFYGAFGS